MLGGYIGQFLPLSGGTLGGALNLGGHDLSFFGNITDSAGNTRIQVINSGSDRALNLCDDTGVATLVITEGDVTLPTSSLTLATGNGMSFDPVAFVLGDGNGNVSFTVTTLAVNPTISGSTGTISGVDLSSSIALSGSVTAIVSGMEARAGMFAYGMASADPPTAKIVYGDTFLPVLKIPSAIFVATVKF